MRKQYPAVQTDNIEFFHENPQAKVFAYVRWNDAGDRVVVIANFSDQTLNGYKVPNFPATGKWCEWLSKSEIETAEDGSIHFWKIYKFWENRRTNKTVCMTHHETG